MYYLNSNIKLARDYFYQQEYKSALNIFLYEKDFYSAGLCYLLLEDKKQAKICWDKQKQNCTASQWGLCVLRFIELKMDKKPSFFQTRAFLEVYINLLLENDLTEWAQNLISCCDYLFYANPESYKFIARALYANGYFDLSITFLNKSLEFMHQDPEALLILSQCQYLTGKGEEAMDTINKTIEIDKCYFPAIQFKNILEKEL